MTDAHEEGWYTDPFARHEARWMSNGTPTRLVRDGDRESYDEPPDEPPSVTPSPIPEPQAKDGEDLLRADRAEGDSLAAQLQDAGQLGTTWEAEPALPDQHDDE